MLSKYGKKAIVFVFGQFWDKGADGVREVFTERTIEINLEEFTRIHQMDKLVEELSKGNSACKEIKKENVNLINVKYPNVARV